MLKEALLPTQPLQRIKFESLRECPSHPRSSPCELCIHREADEPCHCPMCQNILQKQELQRLTFKTVHLATKMTNKLQKRKITSWQLEYILQKMLYPQHKTIVHPFGIFIPEICFYKDGEADVLYFNAQSSEKRPGIWQPPIHRVKKQKLNNTQIQKILNDKRRKYREKVGTAIRRKLTRKISQFDKKQIPPETKDAVVINFTTKDQSYEQLQEENYFIGLMLRRKQDPVFKPIDFIKNFIGITEEDKRVLFCKHCDGKTKYPTLYQRSRTLMRTLASNILPSEPIYISPQEEALFLAELANKNPDAYAYYTIYRIINYIQTFHDEKITLISAKFLLNQLNQLYLLHVYSLQKHQLVKYTWNQQTYLKKIAQAENKMLQRQQRADLLPDSQQKSSMIQSEMQQQYQEMKVKMGLAEVEKNDCEEKANNQFFALLHPELPLPIGELLKDRGLTVQKFQQKYLGYRNNKRSVAARFNSNLVKTLHKMTPPLRVTVAHEIQNKQFPKNSTFYTRGSQGKRSFSMGNTISTVNKTTTIFL